MAGEGKAKGRLEAGTAARRGSPQEIVAAMQAAPKVTREDVRELQRLIREAKSPAPEGGIFD